jgi:hypothetical protein
MLAGRKTAVGISAENVRTGFAASCRMLISGIAPAQRGE